MRQRLEIKIAIIYFIIIVVIIGSYFVAFRTIYVEHEQQIKGEESVKTLHTMKAATLSIIENANNYSKILLADEEVQRVFSEEDIYSNLIGQFKVAQRIYGLLQFEKDITSVYFINQKGQIYFVGEYQELRGQLRNQEELPWYNEIINKNGQYILSIDNQDIVSSPSHSQVSLIRVYKDLNNFKNYGIILVNIDIKAFQNTYKEILKEEEEEIIFLDNKDQVISQNGIALLQDENREKFLEELRASKEGSLRSTVNIENTNYLVTGINIPKLDWKIIRVVPMNINQESLTILTTNITLVLLSSVLILLGTVLVSNLITTPIQSMLASMSKAGEGKFVKIDHKPFFGEFRYLFEGYNKLLDKLDLLLRQTVENQKIIRKVELNEMQEQMKPHFLYNTLDTIQALAVLGELDKVCEIVEALGDFYRKSVSKGREMLTIEEELTIVEDYIKIIKIRFEDLFEEHIEIEERCKAYLIPKLTLQPLVENAIHHGLRGGARQGRLEMSIKLEEDWVHMKIMDNGSGIPANIVEELEETQTDYKGKSFGLRGTIERMRIIYGENFRYQIISTENEQTVISFYIHIEALEV